MESDEAIRALVAEYVEGNIDIDNAIVQLAPLMIGVSHVSLAKTANGSLSPDGRERIKELFNRLQDLQTDCPLHVRRVFVQPMHIAALGLSPSAVTVRVQIYARDAQREHAAWFDLRVQRSADTFRHLQQNWKWDCGRLLVSTWTEDLVNGALADVNSRVTNRSWNDFLQALNQVFWSPATILRGPRSIKRRDPCRLALRRGLAAIHFT